MQRTITILSVIAIICGIGLYLTTWDRLNYPISILSGVIIAVGIMGLFASRKRR